MFSSCISYFTSKTYCKFVLECPGTCATACQALNHVTEDMSISARSGSTSTSFEQRRRLVSAHPRPDLSKERYIQPTEQSSQRSGPNSARNTLIPSVDPEVENCVSERLYELRTSVRQGVDAIVRPHVFGPEPKGPMPVAAVKKGKTPHMLSLMRQQQQQHQQQRQRGGDSSMSNGEPGNTTNRFYASYPAPLVTLDALKTRVGEHRGLTPAVASAIPLPMLVHASAPLVHALMANTTDRKQQQQQRAKQQAQKTQEDEASLAYLDENGLRNTGGKVERSRTSSCAPPPPPPPPQLIQVENATKYARRAVTISDALRKDAARLGLSDRDARRPVLSDPLAEDAHQASVAAALENLYTELGGTLAITDRRLSALSSQAEKLFLEAGSEAEQEMVKKMQEVKLSLYVHHAAARIKRFAELQQEQQQQQQGKEYESSAG